MRYLLLLCLFLSFQSCEKDFEIINDCLDNKLEDLDMIPYTNQEIECKFYVEMYVYLENQYFHIDSHCADVAFNFQNCSGTSICTEEESEFCQAFLDHAEYKGIVGVSE